MELAAMITELKNFSKVRDSIESDLNSKLTTTKQYLAKQEEYQNALGRARTLLLKCDCDGAQRELETVDEGASAEIA
jgi:hypothetical protein